MNQDSQEKIFPQPITEEMHRSYLDYAMSVIVSRALPDVRDGLKPVHRRILYAMWRLKLTHEAKYRKSATVVGEVLGKYHPHGDVPVYEALVRMAQPFSLRYPLVEGQGNFGSLDGDPPAAMRYTEVRLQKIAAEMLHDIDKETVSWQPNYDNTRKEPTVLPAKIPQLILNGSVGIAVGMTTNIPPHNLNEVVDALVALIKNPSLTTQDLMEYIKGPDFPTGGFIYGKKALLEAYSQGRGSFVCRAAAEIEETKKETYQIVVRELVWQVNKAALLEKIAELAKNKKIKGIKTIRDESDREGVRIVIELKKGFQPQKILNKLYKLTDLQKPYHLNMLALVDGLQPQILSLKEVLNHFIEHRLLVIKKRSAFELREAEARAHILEGFSQALKNIDAIIKTIKSSKNKEVAAVRLQKEFNFSQKQAEAILQMRLQSLAGLERQKIDQELKEKLSLIKKLKELLANPEKIKEVLREELEELKEKYGDPRRTKIIARALGEMKEEELIQEQDVVVVLTADGYIKRVQPEIYRKQRRAGYGMLGMVTKEQDLVKHFFGASTTDWILFFTDAGKVFKLRAYEIPEGTRVSKGKPIVNLLELEGSEKVTAALAVKKEILQNEQNHYFIAMATKNGIMKKTPISHFRNLRRSGIRAIKLEKGDLLKWTRLIEEGDHLLLVTKNGQAIRFPSQQLRPMGRISRGVRGIRLREQDEVRSMDVASSQKGQKLIVISEKGLGKVTLLEKFRPQKRGGLGLRAMKVTQRTGGVAGAKLLAKEDQELIVISRLGKVIRTSLKNIPLLSRNAQGVKIMSLKENDQVADFITF